MATHVEAEVVVATTDHPASLTEEEHPTGKEKGGLFRRFKKKNGDEEKSRKPPGMFYVNCTLKVKAYTIPQGSVGLKNLFGWVDQF